MWRPPGAWGTQERYVCEQWLLGKSTPSLGPGRQLGWDSGLGGRGRDLLTIISSRLLLAASTGNPTNNGLSHRNI